VMSPPPCPVIHPHHTCTGHAFCGVLRT
jgi:hypothetical protein